MFAVSMNEPPASRMRKLLLEHLADLHGCCHATCLYGSHLHTAAQEKDIDVLVVAGRQQHSHVFQVVGRAQRELRQIIHPAVVTPNELNANPLLQDLIRNAIVMWE